MVCVLVQNTMRVCAHIHVRTHTYIKYTHVHNIFEISVHTCTCPCTCTCMYMYIIHCGQVSMKITIQFQVIRQAERHLEEVTKERSLYRNAIDTAKESVRQCFSSIGTFTPPGPCIQDTFVFKSNRSSLFV